MTFVNSKEIRPSDARPSDVILDVTTFLLVVAQILDDGNISDKYAQHISWLLGSHKKRLEPVCDLLERLESAGLIDISAEEYRVARAEAEADKP